MDLLDRNNKYAPLFPHAEVFGVPRIATTISPATHVSFSEVEQVPTVSQRQPEQGQLM